MTTIYEKLSAPFAPEAISWRVGSTTQDKSRGLALAYLDSRDVQKRLDEVCGPENWQAHYPWSDGKRLCCEIGIRVSKTETVGSDLYSGRQSEWVWKADGAGETDVEAEKGAFSDAFKRAAVKWGVGRYLYDLDSPWVELEPAGRSYKIKASEMPRLAALLGGKAAPRTAPSVSAPTPAPAAPSPSRDVSGEKRDIVKSITEKPTKTGGAIFEITMQNGDKGATFNKDVAGVCQASKDFSNPIAYTINAVKKGAYTNYYFDTPLPAADEEIAGMDDLAGMP